MESRQAVIVGGGISGLTVAFWLQHAGVDVLILEQQPFPGGTMRTVHDGGWLVETGPNSALETTPLFAAMFEALGISGERIYADPAANRRYILRDGKLHLLPMSPGVFLSTRLWSASGKLRLLREPFIARGTKEETVAEFVERRLGREFLDYAINPFVAGVFAGDPEDLSVRSAFPKLFALEEKYGGLVRGMIGGARERKRRAETAKDRARMFSFKGGMQVFPDALARALGKRIRMGSHVTGIARHHEQSFRVTAQEPAGVSEISARVVVMSVPAYVAGGLVHTFSPALAGMLEDIPYPPVAEVFLGYPLAQVGQPLDGFGFLIPGREQRKILGTIWSSALFPERAPANHAALTTFVGGSRQPEKALEDDTSLLTAVRDELRGLMQVRGEPAYTRITRWTRAIPQYNLGHQKVMDAVDLLEREERGLLFCSNFRGGIAVGDCVKNGRRVAEQALDLLEMGEAKERLPGRVD